MTDFPTRTLDIAETIYRVRANSFGRITLGEWSPSAFTPTPRMGGPRHRLWATEVETTNLTLAQAQAWDALMDRLGSGSFAVRIWDPARQLPLGAGAGLARTGAPAEYLIDGTYYIDGDYTLSGGSAHAYLDADAARHADLVVMTGLVPSSVVFEPGDLFELGDNLYSVIDQAVSDASGVAGVRFAAPLWKAALAGDRVNLHRPTGRFMLADLNAGFTRRADLSATAGFRAVEVPVLE